MELVDDFAMVGNEVISDAAGLLDAVVGGGGAFGVGAEGGDGGDERVDGGARGRDGGGVGVELGGEGGGLGFDDLLGGVS